MYVAVKGGERAIENAHALLAHARRGDPSVPEISLATFDRDIHGPPPSRADADRARQRRNRILRHQNEIDAARERFAIGDEPRPKIRR